MDALVRSGRRAHLTPDVADRGPATATYLSSLLRAAAFFALWPQLKGNSVPALDWSGEIDELSVGCQGTRTPNPLIQSSNHDVLDGDEEC